MHGGVWSKLLTVMAQASEAPVALAAVAFDFQQDGGKTQSRIENIRPQCRAPQSILNRGTAGFGRDGPPATELVKPATTVAPKGVGPPVPIADK
jgi:hypothetical protein